MKIKSIAIQPDHKQRKDGTVQSFSDSWGKIAAKQGILVKEVNAYSNDFFESLVNLDAFLWRFSSAPREFELAKRVIPAIEQTIKIPVFPGSKVVWWVQDKVAQYYLLNCAGLPTARTWVFFEKKSALDFIDFVEFPIVIKLSRGMGSQNVALLSSKSQAKSCIDQLFSIGISSLWKAFSAKPKRIVRSLIETAKSSFGMIYDSSSLEKNCILLQEFLPGNTYDTRVTVIGNYAFSFIRYNRENDFRASGSGKIDYDPKKINIEMVKLAFRTVKILDTPMIAIDFLESKSGPVIVELNFSYASYRVQDCLGAWMLESKNEQITWVPNTFSPEELTFTEFLRLVNS